MATDRGFGIGTVGVGVTLVIGVLALALPGWLTILIATIGGVLIVVGFFVVIQSMWFRKEDAMPTKKPEDDRSIDVRSYHQKGGITAGVVNIQGETQPRIGLSNESYEKTGEGHVYQADLTIETQYVIPALPITAYADSIQSLDVTPQQAGVDTSGNAGKREGYHFTTLQNAAGLYRVKVVTAEPEQVRLDFGS